ncbi:C-X-C chemokine receptor type 4b [Syngnathus scovelli]|uniref:C-X-C chemokine receptor type 4b n=1 Tax=Syngnathus scovelli TaxID=161590 RepID=UPI00210F8919|nr:C-X-C chemokine receptor type 4b [Syngnathus scovelli]XP_049583015.1 C-X-C chemokine receptor type 4b [Syngnathus scovelli]XP_049583016.1 C-X-C chemokine receptor type 4b [Syngnathus scovelli]
MDVYIFNNSSDNFSEESGDFDMDFQEPCGRALGDDFKKIFLPVVFGIIIVLGVIGNGLVVIVMGYQKKVKTMTDKYRLHLSVADLLFVFTLPFWAVDAARNWYFGSFLCVFVHMIYTVNLYSSVLILAFISLDRYLAVVRATNSQATRKLLASKIIYVAVWLPATILTVPDLVFARTQDTGSSNYRFMNDGSMEVADSRIVCQRIYPDESNLTWMVVFRFQHILVGFVLPGLVILVCYCIIIAKLSRGAKGQAQKKKALKTTVILILCFFSCWLPYCVGLFLDTLMMLNVVTPSCELEQAVEKWISITEALAYFHCCLNPILYAFLGVKFKKSAKSALTLNSRSSQKATLVTKKRGQISSVSTESESSSVLSS